MMAVIILKRFAYYIYTSKSLSTEIYTSICTTISNATIKYLREYLGKEGKLQRANINQDPAKNMKIKKLTNETNRQRQKC